MSPRRPSNSSESATATGLRNIVTVESGQARKVEHEQQNEWLHHVKLAKAKRAGIVKKKDEKSAVQLSWLQDNDVKATLDLAKPILELHVAQVPKKRKKQKKSKKPKIKYATGGTQETTNYSMKSPASESPAIGSSKEPVIRRGGGGSGGRRGGGEGGGEGGGDEDDSRASPMDVSPQEEKPSEEKKQCLIKWSTLINHYSKGTCEDNTCEDCQILTAIKQQFEEESKSSPFCEQWMNIIRYHKNNCIFKDNCFCQIFGEKEEAPPKLTRRPSLQCQPKFQYLNRQLEGLDDKLNEINEQWFVVSTSLVSKGGNGEVFPVSIINEDLKERYPIFKKLLVVKKSRVKEEEILFLNLIESRQNYVKVLLVMKLEDGRSLTFMEKADMSLHQYVELKRPEGLDVKEMMTYLYQVVEAVRYSHCLKIPVVHKDIKPQNVLLAKCNNFTQAMLADFDAVRFLGGYGKVCENNITGTPGYLAPEVANLKPHGLPADIFSLGKMALKIFCPQYLHYYTQEAFDWVETNINYNMAVIILYCLKDNPDERPTALQLKQELERVMNAL